MTSRPQWVRPRLPRRNSTADGPICRSSSIGLARISRFPLNIVSAQKDVINAQRAYDAAVDAVLARLQNDRDYKKLIEKRTAGTSGVEINRHRNRSAKLRRHGKNALWFDGHANGGRCVDQ